MTYLYVLNKLTQQMFLILNCLTLKKKNDLPTNLYTEFPGFSKNVPSGSTLQDNLTKDWSGTKSQNLMLIIFLWRDKVYKNVLRFHWNCNKLISGSQTFQRKSNFNPIKIQSPKNMIFIEFKLRKFAEISIYKFPDLVSRVQI